MRACFQSSRRSDGTPIAYRLGMMRAVLIVLCTSACSSAAIGTLVIHGLVCRRAGGGVHPLVMLNHGGFYGIDPTTRDQCVAFAQAGIVAGVSSYRGEDGSQGSVEVCLGEVDDVLAMKAVLSAQPYVDAERVATVGFSHGACIATMLALRDNTLRAAVDFFGPSDIGTEYD